MTAVVAYQALGLGLGEALVLVACQACWSVDKGEGDPGVAVTGASSDEGASPQEPMKQLVVVESCDQLPGSADTPLLVNSELLLVMQPVPLELPEPPGLLVRPAPVSQQL